jgi:ABC-type branched-subunit amino acid transport system permease subunit
MNGALGQMRALASRHRSMTILAGWASIGLLLPLIVLVPPLNVFQPQILWIDGFANAGVLVLLAMGLNVVVGMAGLLDLGYAAFFAIGAYTYALCASPFTGASVPFWPMLLVGAVVAASFGVMLGAPTLRLRGDYLAIVTLGFGEIVPAVILNSDRLTGGTNGIGGIAKPELLGFRFTLGNPVPYYIAMVAIIAVTMVILYRFQGSRLGRAWMAVREDELAAATSGINPVSAKLLAFAIGASTAGLAGVFMASKLTTVSPEQFSFTVSFTVLAMVVLGGMGNIWGVAVGAFVVYTIQAVVLKQLNPFFTTINIPILKEIDFIQYQYLLYGLSLVAMMLLRPEGLFPSNQRRRELHEDSGEPFEELTDSGASGAH